jgi:hypothetical protein
MAGTASLRHGLNATLLVRRVCEPSRSHLDSRQNQEVRGQSEQTRPGEAAAGGSQGVLQGGRSCRSRRPSGGGVLGDAWARYAPLGVGGHARYQDRMRGQGGAQDRDHLCRRGLGGGNPLGLSPPDTRPPVGNPAERKCVDEPNVQRDLEKELAQLDGAFLVATPKAEMTAPARLPPEEAELLTQPDSSF